MNVWRWSNADTFGGLQFGMSFRDAGELKDIPTQTLTPAGRVFLDSVGVSLSRSVLAPLEHGTTVFSVTTANVGTRIPRCDGLATALPGVCLTITVSDCFPVVLFDPVSPWFSVLHAGWRGISNQIVRRACEVKERIDGRVDRLAAWIGPGIQSCHFEVGEDVAEYFSLDTQLRHGRTYVDLRAALSRQLKEQGIASVSVDDRCTACDASTFFSYRRDKPPRPQTMLAYACLR